MQSGNSVNKKNMVKGIIIDNIPFIGLVGIVIAFYFITKGNLLSKNNLMALLNQSFLMIIACVGSIFIYMQGGLDLSITNAIGTCSIMGALALNKFGLPGCIIAILVTGLFLGSFNGFIYSRTNIQPFILTLSVNLILDGLNYTITNQRTVIQIARSYQKMFNVLEFKILILATFSIITYYLYKYTTLGKESRAIGAGEDASRQSGINVKSVKMMAFIFTGLTAALYAFMAMMKTGGGGPTAGANIGFNVMIAMVLGGTTTAGGLAAKFKSCFIGSLIITVLTNSLSMIGISSMLQEVIKGLSFVLVVAFSTRLRNKFLGNIFVVRKKVKKCA